MVMMPPQKPGKSEQVVETPTDFIEAVKTRLRIPSFGFDLAASPENAKAPAFFTEKDNALVQTWHTIYGWSWLNPPYSHIEPWVAKAGTEAKQGAHIAMLVPASVGSAWWFNYVTKFAYVTFLNPRLTFVGHTSPYPKDLALLLFAPFLHGGSTNWVWK